MQSTTDLPATAPVHDQTAVYQPWLTLPASGAFPPNGRWSRCLAPAGGIIGLDVDHCDPKRAVRLRLAAALIHRATGQTCVADYLTGSRHSRALVLNRISPMLATALRARPEHAPELFSFADDPAQWMFWRIHADEHQEDTAHPRDQGPRFGNRLLHLHLTRFDDLPL